MKLKVSHDFAEAAAWGAVAGTGVVMAVAWMAQANHIIAPIMPDIVGITGCAVTGTTVLIANTDEAASKTRVPWVAQMGGAVAAALAFTAASVANHMPPAAPAKVLGPDSHTTIAMDGDCTGATFDFDDNGQMVLGNLPGLRCKVNVRKAGMVPAEKTVVLEGSCQPIQLIREPNYQRIRAWMPRGCLPAFNETQAHSWDRDAAKGWKWFWREITESPMPVRDDAPIPVVLG